MALINVALAEEALSLSPADLAKLLIQSLEGERRTNEDVKAELVQRLQALTSKKDPGLTFEQVFERPM